MVRQRSYAIALGHDQLRHDPAMQTAAERDSPLASAPTLCRFENQAAPDWARSMHEVLVQTFLAAHPTPPEEIVLDIDATDDVVHGHQVGSFFHGCYDHYCFLPLCVLAGDHLPVAWLRPANVDGARHAGAIMKLLITRLRQEWPETRFVIRADSGFCRRRLMSWCDRNSVDYIIGLPGNPRLTRLVAPETAEAGRAFIASGRKRFRFAERFRGAESRDRERRVIARLGHGPGGAGPRFIVTSLKGECEALCRKVCCQRGEMENRIRDKQLQLFADRTSCHEWRPNRFRLLPAGLACTLINEIRRIALASAGMARARCVTIRLKLPKTGAVITRNTRRIRLPPLRRLSRPGPLPACRWQAQARMADTAPETPRQQHDARTAPCHREPPREIRQTAAHQRPGQPGSVLEPRHRALAPFITRPAPTKERRRRQRQRHKTSSRAFMKYPG